MSNMVDGLNRIALESQQTVFSTGEDGECAYVIESGCVEVLAGTGDAQKRVAVLTEGAMFGEVALLDRQPRTATVRTLMPTRLVMIDRAHVEELLLRADPVIQYLLRLMLQRFRNTNGTVTEDTRPALDLHSAAVHTLSLAHDLADGIAHNQLALYYQPIVLLEDNAPAGFESLVRWAHPKLGLISPDEFIPLAEKTGLIHKVGEWVLGHAIADWEALRGLCRGAAKSPPFMSVNLSAPELSGAGMADKVLQQLRSRQMNPQELRIELTETVIVSSLDAVTRTINALRAEGIGIALDDFGTGYAGLDYLQSLPFSCLKIDKVFVQQMHTSERSYQIVKSALELSRQMGLSTVAEGIEDAATARVLQAMGCTYGQGYYFAKPMPLAAVQAWAKTYGA